METKQPRLTPCLSCLLTKMLSIPLLALIILSLLYLAFLHVETKITLSAPPHTPLSVLTDPVSLESLLLSSNKSNREERDLRYFARELAPNISVRAGYGGHIIIGISHFHSRIFELNGDAYSRIAVFLAQSYAAEYSRSVAGSLAFRFSPYAAEASVYENLTKLYLGLYAIRDRFYPEAGEGDDAEEDYNAYFADLCGEISPRKNRQMLYLWYRFRLLTEEAGEFEGILAGEEGEAFAGTKEARYWLRGMYEELLEWGERYNAELMETAWLIYERHLMICAEPRHEISSPYGEMLSCGVPMAVLFFLYVVMRRGGMPCAGHACGERSCGEGSCGERHACGEGASSAGHACGKPPQKQTDVQERDEREEQEDGRE